MKILAALGAVALATVAASAVQAADLPAYEAPLVSAPSFSWTGAYVGVSGGYTFSDRKIRTSGRDAATNANVAAGLRPSSLKIDGDDFLIGATLGYNQQFDSFVVGLETDFSYSNVDERARYAITPNAAGAPPGTIVSNFRQELEYLGTVRGRLGYAFDRILVYGTGGLAYGKVKTGASFRNGSATGAAPGAPNAAGAEGFAGNKSNWETGYTIGGGLEYAITDSLSLKGEYLYYDLGDTKLNVDNTGIGGAVPAAQAGYKSKFQNDGHIIRAGLNYKFNSF